MHWDILQLIPKGYNKQHTPVSKMTSVKLPRTVDP